MKHLPLIPLLALALGASAQAKTATENATDAPPFEEVRNVYVYGGFHDFDVIDDDSLILWATPFRPYLVELTRPSIDLPFAQVIVVESAASWISPKFDAVTIRGWRYPIKQIFKLTREEARGLIRET
jgi:Family of unknown function (DUF6491)